MQSDPNLLLIGGSVRDGKTDERIEDLYSFSLVMEAAPAISLIR